MKKISKKILNDEGQSTFEFLIFLPFLLMFYVLIVSISGAISASINQQKATRGYFYARLAHNSMAPGPRELRGVAVENRVGTYSIGWRHYSQGVRPVAACFQLVSAILGGEGNQDCNARITDGEPSKYLWVETMYGICSTTYSKIDDRYIRDNMSAHASSCTLD